MKKNDWILLIFAAFVIFIASPIFYKLTLKNFIDDTLPPKILLISSEFLFLTRFLIIGLWLGYRMSVPNVRFSQHYEYFDQTFKQCIPRNFHDYGYIFMVIFTCLILLAPFVSSVLGYIAIFAKYSKADEFNVFGMVLAVSISLLDGCSVSILLYYFLSGRIFKAIYVEDLTLIM